MAYRVGDRVIATDVEGLEHDNEPGTVVDVIEPGKYIVKLDVGCKAGELMALIFGDAAGCPFYEHELTTLT